MNLRITGGKDIPGQEHESKDKMLIRKIMTEIGYTAKEIAEALKGSTYLAFLKDFAKTIKTNSQTQSSNGNNAS